MQKNVKQKIFTYVQSGQVTKLRLLLEKCSKKCQDFGLDFVSGSMHRTPLHNACLLGDDAVVRCLLRFGASAEIVDKDGDTAVHLAAKFAGEDGNYSSHKLLLDPLLKRFPQTIDIKNRSDETPSDLLKEAKEKHKTFLKATTKSWEEEFGSSYVDNDSLVYRATHALSDKSWNEKLANSWDDDCADVGMSSQYFVDEEWASSVPDYPTFEQWADRMAAEYRRKKLSEAEKVKRQKEENRKRKLDETKNLTDRLEKEREKYRKVIAQKKTDRLKAKHDDYKSKMTKHISDKTTVKKLRFKDIPWPCLGTVKEMIEVIMSGCTAENDHKERRKYILKQQILWHPDKFSQRCNDSLDPNDKDSVLDTVKLLSQSLNQLLKQS